MLISSNKYELFGTLRSGYEVTNHYPFGFFLTGLEGGSSEENDLGGHGPARRLEARQSAEGDAVMSPVPGDGGGGGDGSSGRRSVNIY